MGFVRLSGRLPQDYLVLAACLFGVWSCEGLFRDVPSNCDVTSNPLARQEGFEVVHEQPNRCPVSVPFDVAARGGIATTFEGVVTAPESVPFRYADGTQLVRIRFFDNNQTLRQQGYREFSDDPGNSQRVRSDILGSYDAGIAGFQSFGNDGLDLSSLEVETIQGLASASVFLPYRSPQATTVSGVGYAAEGSQFTMEVVNHDPTAVPPLTHEWFRDGASFGPPSSAYTSLTDAAGDPGQTQSYEVRTTDAHGYSHTAYHNVWITYAGSPTCLDPPCP